MTTTTGSLENQEPPVPSDAPAAPPPAEDPNGPLPPPDPRSPTYDSDVVRARARERRLREVREGPFGEQNRTAQGLTESEETPETPAAPAPQQQPTPQQAPPQQRPAPAAPAAAKPSGGPQAPMVTVVIDGAERQVPASAVRHTVVEDGRQVVRSGDEVAAGYQMRTVSDQRFREASASRQQVNDFLARNPEVLQRLREEQGQGGTQTRDAPASRAQPSGQQSPTPEAETLTDREILDRLQYRDGDDALAGLKALKDSMRQEILRDLGGPPDVRGAIRTELQANRIQEQRERFANELQQEFPEVIGDPRLRAAVDAEVAITWARELEDAGYDTQILNRALTGGDEGRRALAAHHAALMRNGIALRSGRTPTPYVDLVKGAFTTVRDTYVPATQRSVRSNGQAQPRNNAGQFVPAANHPGRVELKRQTPTATPPATLRQGDGRQAEARPETRQEQINRMRHGRALPPVGG
jgi:hypothetical protein